MIAGGAGGAYFGSKYQSNTCICQACPCSLCIQNIGTVEIQWLEHLLNHENMFETRVVRANECQS